MKLARFTAPDGRPSFGVVTDADVIALDHRVDRFATLLSEPASRQVRADDPRWPLADVRWQPPVEPASKVICVGFNYAAHAAESTRKPAEHVGRGFDVVEHVPLFLRYPDSFVGSGGSVVRPFDSDTLDWEGEIALVIGIGGRRIDAEDGLTHVAGFTCMAENSVREWQAHSNQATAGKNWDRSGAIGPWVVTTDEVGSEPLTLTTVLNGEQVQSATTAELILSFGQIIAYISSFTNLNPGDVIATGTPSGIGFRQDPPRYLRPGDELTVEISRVGILRHTVVDEQIPARV